MNVKLVLCALSALFMLTAGPRYAAAASYPARRITLVVPFTPGGTSDSIARPFAQVMSKVAGVPVVVLNKPGANGEVGTAYVAHSRADGYTILIALQSFMTAPITDRMTGRKPVFKESELEPIARITSDPTIVATYAGSKWKTLTEFVEDAKAHPGQLTFSSAGAYSVDDISMLLLSHSAGINVQQVPFNGGGEVIMALLGKQVDLGSNTYGTLSPYFKSGQLRPLVVQGDERLPQLPNVPTTGELGYEDAAYAFWTGIFAPAATPKDIVAKLREITKKTVESPAFVKAIAHLGDTIAYLDKPQFITFMQTNGKHQIALIKNLGPLSR